MNIEDMIWNGASEEEIMNAIAKVQKEKTRQEEALAAKKRLEAEAQKEQANKEELKAEARAYMINALIVYSEAFDLLPEGENWSDEDIAKAEEMLKKLEDMIPLYIKLAQMQGDMDKLFGADDMDFGGFFGRL